MSPERGVRGAPHTVWVVAHWRGKRASCRGMGQLLGGCPYSPSLAPLGSAGWKFVLHSLAPGLSPGRGLCSATAAGLPCPLGKAGSHLAQASSEVWATVVAWELSPALVVAAAVICACNMAGCV